MRTLINILLYLLFLVLLLYFINCCAVHVEYIEAFSFLPMLAGLGVSAVGGAIGNWLSSGNAEHLQTLSYQDNLNLQKDAQAFNSAEASKTRQYNTAERLASQQFTEDMWNKTNAYNSPSAQIERFRAAGVNPLSATMQSSQAQNVSNSPQASSSAASSPANSVGIPGMQNMSFASDFANLYDTAVRADNIEQQTKLLEKDNETRSTENYLRLLEARARIENSNADTSVKQRELNHIDAMINKIYAEYNAITVTSHATKMNADTLRMEVENAYKLGKERNAIEAFKASIQDSLASSQIKLNASEQKHLDSLVDKVGVEMDELRERAKREHWTERRLQDEYKIFRNKYRGILDENSSLGRKFASSFLYTVDNFFNGVSASLPLHH